MNKQFVLPVVLGVIVFGLGFPDSALATNKPIDITSLGDEVGLSGETVNGATIETSDQADAAPVALGAGAVAAILWATMTPSDLGVDSVGTLPTSPFYFLKEWKRGITRIFTFGPIAKAQLELNITNQIAAEVLEVNKANPNDAGALTKALENFTNAQERLNARITTINGTANIQGQFAELLTDVDEKTAKHVVLLDQIAERWGGDPYAEDSARKGSIGDPDFDLLAKRLEDAQDNILKTFTITVTSVNDEPSLKQKAEEQIKLAGVAIEEANNALMGVSTTRGTWRPSTGGNASQNVTVPKQTQGATFGDKVKTGGSDSGESDIFDRWGNSITKAKSHLANAKEAFAEEKYGEAYGLARSAEAIADGIRGTIDPGNQAAGKEPIRDLDGQAPGKEFGDKTAPSSSTTTSNKPVTELDIEDTPTPQAAGSKSATSTEKTETAQPSGSGAGPASNYDRDN